MDETRYSGNESILRPGNEIGVEDLKQDWD